MRSSRVGRRTVTASKNLTKLDLGSRACEARSEATPRKPAKTCFNFRVRVRGMVRTVDLQLELPFRALGMLAKISNFSRQTMALFCLSEI